MPRPGTAILLRFGPRLGHPAYKKKQKGYIRRDVPGLARGNTKLTRRLRDDHRRPSPAPRPQQITIPSVKSLDGLLWSDFVFPAAQQKWNVIILEQAVNAAGARPFPPIWRPHGPDCCRWQSPAFARADCKVISDSRAPNSPYCSPEQGKPAQGPGMEFDSERLRGVGRVHGPRSSSRSDPRGTSPVQAHRAATSAPHRCRRLWSTTPDGTWPVVDRPSGHVVNLAIRKPAIRSSSSPSPINPPLGTLPP